MPLVTILAIAHLHAFMRRSPQTGYGLPPDVAAVSADAVHLINAHPVGFAVGRMTLCAAQVGALEMNRVREKDICRLSRVHEPRRLVPLLDIGVDQGRFGFALPDPFGMAAGAFFHWRETGERSVVSQDMTFIAVREA